MSYDEPLGSETGKGWEDIILYTHQKLKYVDPEYNIRQIKEKFGGLRYYFDTSFEYSSIPWQVMKDIVRSAEQQASLTCEQCGVSDFNSKLELRVHRGFYYTNCEECSNKTIKEREEYFENQES